MSAAHWKGVGGVVLVMLAIGAGDCGFANGIFRQCMSQTVHGIVSYALAAGAFTIGGWLGVETASATHRTWLGWVVGIVVAFALAFLMMWLGFDPPAGSVGD